jgi:RNA polymerase sigma factor (sigma-70 family)
MSDPLSEIVPRATAGDQRALEDLVQAIQHQIYGLALRMLGHPEDAADATQEILLRIITRLNQFRGESAFRTWAYRVAANHLMNMRAGRREQRASTLDQLGEDLAAGLAVGQTVNEDDPEQHLLLEEIRIGCTQGMLLCLDRPHRLAFILGTVFQVSGEEGAAILEISPAAYRQRLARARRSLHAFMEQSCGLVSQSAACRCARQVQPAIQSGRLNPHELQFASHPQLSSAATQHARAEIIQLGQVAGVFRSHPQYRAPERYIAAIRELLATSQLRVLRPEL